MSRVTPGLTLMLPLLPLVFSPREILSDHSEKYFQTTQRNIFGVANVLDNVRDSCLLQREEICHNCLILDCIVDEARHVDKEVGFEYTSPIPAPA